jgi:hypothetical protein
MAQPFGRWLTVVVGSVNRRHRPLPVLQGLQGRLPGRAQVGRDERTRGHVGHSRRAARVRGQGRGFGRHRCFPRASGRSNRPGQSAWPGRRPADLARQPFGPYLLGAVAAGLMAYGAFMFVMARYRRSSPPEGASVSRRPRHHQYVVVSPCCELVTDGDYPRTDEERQP